MNRNHSKTLNQESKVTSSDNNGQENEASFALILGNPAFKFIVNQICETLSVSDMAKCHCVSKRFHEILLNNKPWWIAQLRLMKTIKYFKYADVHKTDPIDGHNWIEKRPPESIIEKFPEWSKVFDYFENIKDTITLQEFTLLLKSYFNAKNVYDSPLFYVLRENKIRSFE